MSFGYWGVRIPLLNIVISKILFLVIWYRLVSIRLKNLLKRLIKRQSLNLANSDINVKSMRHYLKDGYDRINIGGGAKNLSGFINIDFISYPNIEREIIANILDLSFIPTNSISQIHSNHVIEHLSSNQIIMQFQEYNRILKDNGVLSIRCPNALDVSYGFWFEPVLEDDKDEFIALGFPLEEDFANPADIWFHKDLFGLLHWFYGDLGNVANQHLTIITPTKICDYLKSSGFEIIKISKPEAINLVVIARKIENH